MNQPTNLAKGIMLAVLLALLGWLTLRNDQPSGPTLAELATGSSSSPSPPRATTPAAPVSPSPPRATTPAAPVPAPTVSEAAPQQSSPAGMRVTDPSRESLEYQLAYLDAGTMKLDRDAVGVRRIKFLLDELVRMTKEGRQQIADQTTQAVSVARDKYGLALTHLRLLEEMRDFFSAKPRNVPTTYREATSLYILVNK